MTNPNDLIAAQIVSAFETITHNEEPSTTYCQKNIKTVGGLTIREYFASKAPDNIPDWFKIDFEYPTLSCDGAEQLHAYHVDDSNWLKQMPFTIKVLQSLYGDEVSAHIKKLNNYDLEYEKARFFAWRTYYADNLINELNK